MKVELLMSQLRHELCHVLRINSRVVAICSRRFVRIAEASEVWSHESEMRGEKRKYAVPVEAVLWGSMEEEESWACASSNVMHPDTIDAEAAMVNWLAGVVVCLCKFGHLGECEAIQVAVAEYQHPEK